MRAYRMRLMLAAALLLLPFTASAADAAAPAVGQWAPLIQAVAMFITSVAIPFGMWAYERRTGVQINDQERAAVNAAAKTTAGIVETMIDQGGLRVGDVTPANPTIQALSAAALNRVPDAAKSQGTTTDAMAAIVVGLANTKPAPPVVVVPVIDQQAKAA